MSGSVSRSTAAFTDAERTDIRRFCGYPAFGAGPASFQGWRFFQAYGLLEFRMTNLAPAEFQVVRQYLATLYGLETAVPGAGANLDTDQAAVWTHNKNEVADRSALYGQWCRRLAAFMGVPVGPNFVSGGGAGSTVAMIV